MPIQFAQRQYQGADMASTSDELIRAYSADGRFIGIMRWIDADQLWRPHKTFTIEPEPER